MSKPNEKLRALRLRKNGMSIGLIAKKLNVSKSTVSCWCKDISLTHKQLQKIAELSRHHATLSLLKASELKRAERQLNIEKASIQGKNEVGQLSKRDVYMVGLGLYWGEGYKKGSQELGFTNSDPKMVRFYIYWLNNIYDIRSNDLILRVSINNLHEKRILEIERYWSDLIGIPLVQFTKTSLIKTPNIKLYEKSEKYFGTLRIKVRRGTNLRRVILGSITSLDVK